MTYREAADDFILNQLPNVIQGISQFDGGEEQEAERKLVQEGIIAFAIYLDRFSTIDDKLQMLAMTKAREIDREVLLALAAQLPGEKVRELIGGIYGKHKHTKVEPLEPISA